MPGALLNDAERIDLRDRLAIRLVANWIPKPYQDSVEGEKATRLEEQARSISRAALLIADAFVAVRIEHEPRPR